MKVNYGCGALAIIVLISPALGQDASLTVSDISLVDGEPGVVVVFGEVNDLSTFGVSLLVEIVPRAGSVGVVEFTPAPPVDVHQLGDPWKGAGMYTAFDTDTAPFSASLNGYIDDELQAERRDLFERHLDSCEDCRRYLAAYRWTMAASAAALPAVDTALGQVPENLVRAILEAREAQKKSD